MARLLPAVGLAHVSLYGGTKHSFATDAIRRGVPERLLQKFLGHAHPESSRRYARLVNSALVQGSAPMRVATDKPPATGGAR